MTIRRPPLKLAFLGSIRDEIVDGEELAGKLLLELNRLCPEKLRARFKKVEEGMEPHQLLDAVCASRGFILSGGVYDTERGQELCWRSSARAKLPL